MNAVTPFLAEGTAVAVPAHIASLFGDDTNIKDRTSVPKLSFKGKVWRISLDGNDTPLMRKNADGEEEPIPVMKVIILDHNIHRGRAYYEGAYDSTKDAAPVCWSADGKTPDADVPEPCAASCDTCQFSAKGSKVSETGAQGTACSSFRNIVVVPAADPKFQPLRLRLPITSIYDATNPEQDAKHWFAYDQFLNFLRTKGVKHTASIVTKIKFDPNPNISYPKLLFSPEGWVPEAAAAVVNDVLTNKRAELDTLTGNAPKAPAHAAPEAPAPAAAPAAPATTTRRAPSRPKAAPAAAPAIDPDTGDPVAATPATPPAAPAAPAAPAGTPQVVETNAAIPAAVKSLLNSWDD